MTSPTFYDIEGYWAALAEQLQLPPIEMTGPDRTFVDDLGLDSLRVLELILVTEELAAIIERPSHVPELVTLGDAYNYYRSCVDQT